MRRSIASVAWLVPLLCVVATTVLSGWSPLTGSMGAPGLSQFTPFHSDSTKILEGNWQSCREADGQYAERVYDHVVNGVGKFEVHMGPRREFAIFKGVQDTHREHDSADNLLKPFRVAMDAGRAKQRWEIPSLNLVFTAALAGGSRTDCESWFIVLEALEKTSH